MEKKATDSNTLSLWTERWRVSNRTGNQKPLNAPNHFFLFVRSFVCWLAVVRNRRPENVNAIDMCARVRMSECIYFLLLKVFSLFFVSSLQFNCLYTNDQCIQVRETSATVALCTRIWNNSQLKKWHFYLMFYLSVFGVYIVFFCLSLNFIHVHIIINVWICLGAWSLF